MKHGAGGGASRRSVGDAPGGLITLEGVVPGFAAYFFGKFI